MRYEEEEEEVSKLAYALLKKMDDSDIREIGNAHMVTSEIDKLFYKGYMMYPVTSYKDYVPRSCKEYEECDKLQLSLHQKHKEFIDNFEMEFGSFINGNTASELVEVKKFADKKICVQSNMNLNCDAKISQDENGNIIIQLLKK